MARSNQASGVLGLDGLPRSFKILNWLAAALVATAITLWNYPRFPVGLNPSANTVFGVWVLLGPSLIAAAWLRLTGLRWLHALAVIPPVVIVSVLAVYVLAVLFIGSFF